MTKDWLKDKVTGDKFYPITHEEAVIDNNGTALNTKLAAKLDLLVSGTNIKTINNTSILGSGDISLTPKVASTTDNAIVRFDGTGGLLLNSSVTIDDSGNILATSFIKSGGTSKQYLKADGSATEGIPVFDLTYPDILRGQTFAESSMAMINTMRGNCFALLPPDLIIIEKTTDGGTTWVDAEVTDALKATLFLGTNNLSSIKIPLLEGIKNKNCGIRITFTAMKYNVPANTSETLKYNYWNSSYVLSTERYSVLLNLYLWVSSSNDFIRTKIYGAKGNDSNNWVEVTNGNMYLSGWSGGNYIKLKADNYSFGGDTSLVNNYWNYRIICFTDGDDGGDLADTSTSSLQVIYRIQGFGYNKYTVPNNIMGMDHLYTWDSTQNMILPANLLSATTETLNLGASNNYWNNIYAKKFIIKNGTSSLFLKADGSVDSNTYATTSSLNNYYTKSDINTMLGDIESILDAIIGSDSGSSII